MELKLKDVSIHMGGQFFIAFFLAMFLGVEVHEFAHYISVYAQGGILYAAFNTWSASGNLQWSICCITGPIATYALMWAGMVLILKSVKFRVLGFTLVFAAEPLFRLFAPSHLGGGDEVNFMNSIGLPELLAIPFTLVFILPPLVIAYRSIQNSRRPLIFLLFFLALWLVLILIVFVPDFLFLQPLVEQSYLTGVPATPMLAGIPIVIIVVDVIVILLFFGKFIRYLIPPFPNQKIIQTISSSQ